MKKDKIMDEDLALLIFNNYKTIFGKTYIQKLIFIIKNELNLDNYGYDAYFYGPYSKDINDHVKDLVSKGYVQEKIKTLKNKLECYTYSITEDGKRHYSNEIDKRIPITVKNKIIEICKRFSNFTPIQLLKYVYQVYPKFMHYRA